MQKSYKGKKHIESNDMAASARTEARLTQPALEADGLERGAFGSRPGNALRAWPAADMG